MNFLPTGGYIEGSSPVHRMDAFAKLLCTLLFLTAVILSNTPAKYGLVLVLLAVIIRLSSIGFSNALNGVAHMWLFFLIILFMNAAFFESSNPLFSWWIFHISSAGILQGINVVFRVTLAMVLGNILLATTPPLELIRAMERFLSPLRYLGVPTQEVAMILGVAIQFIPTFMEEADWIKKAQTARGARFESKHLLERAKCVLPLVIPIFLSAFKRADELSVAMEARGYRKSSRTGFQKHGAFHPAEMMSIFLSCLLCVVTVIL